MEKCVCYKVLSHPHKKGARLVCYSQGVVGTLSKEQMKQCKKKEMKHTSKKMNRQLEKFCELGEVSKVCLTSEESKTTNAFYKCVSDVADEL